ncbi:MAG TPA: hypothetical protein VGV40_02970 [Solirubrobacteraceae bacterium]|nr:hypothetical protein [Solirubrobacteraceae bacterium]
MRIGPTVPALTCLALAALTVALLPSTPAYDPWAWIVWGREIVQLDLNTTFGPSWKPLPVLFTTPFALAGDLAPDLWLVVARATALGAVVAAYRLGARLAGPLAGVVAGLVLALQESFFRTQGMGFSEGALVLCGLLAVERHLDGRRGQAFALSLAGGLLRPEAWPFVGLYALSLLWEAGRSAEHRAALAALHRLPWVAGGLATMLALWVLPELWGSGSLFRAAERANDPNPGSPAFSAVPSLTILVDFLIALGPLGVLGLLLVPLTARTRGAQGTPRRALTAVAALGGSWLGLVALMTEVGFAGNLRYLFMPLGLGAVIAGVGIAWATAALALGRDTAAARRGVTAAAAGLAAVLVAGTAAATLPREFELLGHEARLRDELPVAIARAGGPEALRSCGAVITHPLLVPTVAWELKLPTAAIDLEGGAPAVALRTRHKPEGAVTPSRGVLAGAPDRTVLARTPLWEVVGACR